MMASICSPGARAEQNSTDAHSIHSSGYAERHVGSQPAPPDGSRAANSSRCPPAAAFTPSSSNSTRFEAGSDESPRREPAASHISDLTASIQRQSAWLLHMSLCIRSEALEEAAKLGRVESQVMHYLCNICNSTLEIYHIMNRNICNSILKINQIGSPGKAENSLRSNILLQDFIFILNRFLDIETAESTLL